MYFVDHLVCVIAARGLRQPCHPGDIIEIINDTRGGIEVKLGNAANGGGGGGNLGPGYKIMLSLAKLKLLTNGNMSTHPGLEFAPQ